MPLPTQFPQQYPMQGTLLAFLVALVIYVALLPWRRRKSLLPLPPGPRPFPLIGNVLDMPTSVLPEEFDKLTADYGDVVHLDVLGQHMVLLGSYEAASELLEHRSSNYSDRAPSAMADLTGSSWILVLLRYGQEWRRRRKAFHQFFHLNATHHFRPIQEQQTRRLLQDVLRRPNALFQHIRLAFSATVMRIVYGIEITGIDDEYLLLEEDALKAFDKAFVPGKYLVEIFPFLRYIPRWLPGAQFRRDAETWKELFVRMKDKPYDATLQTIRRAGYERSMVSEMVLHVNTDEDDLVARDVAGVTYIAGADTVLSTIHVFFLAMLSYPEVQQKAQAELDAVVGPDRLPGFDDHDALPYLQALILECMRWKPVIQIVFPHRSLEEDVYRGWRIPAGSVILPNSWSLARDERYYPDPQTFRPERYLKDGCISFDGTLDPRIFVFGYGRRICPGRHFAESAVFITAACVLHTLCIEPSLDAAGMPLIPEGKMKPGFLSYPEPFECRVMPRSERAKVLIFEDVNPC